MKKYIKDMSNDELRLLVANNSALREEIRGWYIHDINLQIEEILSGIDQSNLSNLSNYYYDFRISLTPEPGELLKLVEDLNYCNGDYYTFECLNTRELEDKLDFIIKVQDAYYQVAYPDSVIQEIYDKSEELLEECAHEINTLLSELSEYLNGLLSDADNERFLFEYFYEIVIDSLDDMYIIENQNNFIIYGDMVRVY